MSGKSVAIVGATGAVGEELLRVLEQREFPVSRLRALASPRSAGSRVTFRGEAVEVEPLREEVFRHVEIALFSAGGSVSREFAPKAVAAGAVVVDNSSAFRMDPKVPLVVPEVNGEAAAGHEGIVANPNCSTILLVLVLAPIHRAVGVRRVVVSTYQAASGAGRRAMEEMRTGVRALLAGEAFEPRVLPHSLALNLFPQVDVFQPDAYSKEEDKMRDESRKILDLPDLQVEATCVRVPVDRCHSESVGIELARDLDPAGARQVLAAAPGVEVVDEPGEGRFPQPRFQAGRDPVAVGRIRASRVFSPGLSLWLVGDQLRKGAALNAVQIAENLY